MGRPKKYDYPANMTFDGDRERYVVRNPVTKKVQRFEDESKARAVAEALNEWLECERQAHALEAGRPTIGALCARWERDRLQFMPWDGSTRKTAVWRLRRITRELGTRSLVHTDCMFLEDWMASFCKTADQFNKWRGILVLLWRFAVSRKLASTCEPEKIEQRSTSRKLEMNRKVRQQLDLDGFSAIYKAAPAYLQLAMDDSLVTLQARMEVCNMMHADFRDGFLFVIRDKVSGDSDMAFIKIKITEQIEELRRRALLLDDIASPYLVHRAPDRRRREWLQGKPHWSYVTPDYLTKAFAETRDACGHYNHLEARQRPTFHEIRGLGARTYLARGMGERDIQSLMTHSQPHTTQIYLDRGKAALTDDDFVTVEAPLVLKELWGIKG